LRGQSQDEQQHHGQDFHRASKPRPQAGVEAGVDAVDGGSGIKFRRRRAPC
jgi:hypothetical protein